MSQKRKLKAPSKSFRTGVTIIELFERFPNDEVARKWFEGRRWPNGARDCPHCRSTSTSEVKNAHPQSYQCYDCKKFFSAKIGSIMHGSRISYQKWVMIIYFYVTNLKGVSSLKLHRDLGVTQKTAWYMLHRYVSEFEGRKNLREMDTIDQMKSVTEGFVGKRLKLECLTR